MSPAGFQPEDLECPTAKPTPTPTPALGCDTGLIRNGGFETGDFTTWVIDGTIPSPVVTNALSHSGRFSAFAGGNPPMLQYCGFGNEPSRETSRAPTLAVGLPILKAQRFAC